MNKSQEDTLLKAIQRLEARLDALESNKADEEEGGQLAENLHLKLNDLADAVTKYIEAHPVRSATIALILGLVLASRRGGR